jgi:hypothetical protein
MVKSIEISPSGRKEKEERMAWLKGNFPAWITSVLFMLVVGAGKYEIERLDKDRQEFKEQLRVASAEAVELKLKAVRVEEQTSTLQRGQDEMVKELKGIRADLMALSIKAIKP